MYLYVINIKLTCHWRGRGCEPGLRTFKHFGLESQNKNLIIKMCLYIFYRITSTHSLLYGIILYFVLGAKIKKEGCLHH